MPAVLTHKTIMLLTRERLARIRDTLKRKLDSGARVTDLEYRVWYLAHEAHRLMSENVDTPPAIDYPTNAAIYPTPLGQGVSRFSVMGSMGPDIPAFAALFAKGQAWVFDTVHKGNPDANRELVVAKTHTFALELWQQVRRAVSEGRASEDDAKKLAGYVLGHLCHIAADVISHPYINDLEWHQGNRTRGKFSHSGGEGAIDARVAQQVLLRGSTREGQGWDVWWPTFDEVPGAFFPAYVEALKRVYETEDGWPKGFRQFQDELEEHQPPPLDAALIEDGYRFYRQGVVGMGYAWGYWRWFGFLTPVMVPLLAMFPLVAAFPHSRQFIERELPDVDERAWSELLLMPMTLGLIPAAFYGIWLSSLTTKSVESLHTAGLCVTGMTAVLAVAFLATLGAETPWWAHWLVMALPWGLASGAFAVKALVDLGKGDKARMALDLIYGLPFIFALVALLLVLLLVSTFRELGEGGGVGGFIALIAIVSIGVLVGWFLLPRTLRDARIPEQAEPFPADRPHFVRLFDDTTLWAMPDKAASPTLADLHFPSARRKLLKLWWEGTGDLYVRSERSRLDFRFTNQGAPTGSVEAPVTPMTAKEYAEYLNHVFVGLGDQRNKLKAALFYPEDADVELPPGATFSEPFDPDAGHDAPPGEPPESIAWRKLGTTEANTEAVLYHVDKPYQSVRFGKRGPVESATPEDDAVQGPGRVTTNGLVVFGHASTNFDTFFEEGDQIAIGGQVRTVTRVESELTLRVASPFFPEITTQSEYERVGPGEEARDGYVYVTDPRVPPRVVGGDAIMDLAADLGALLCMGMTPHLLSDAQRNVPELQGKQPRGGGAPVAPGVSKVYQVFRNWSLDRRRVNEWRMLVQGGAYSEKGGNVAALDPVLPQDGQVAPQVTAGEPVSNAMGWVPLLREWLARVERPESMAADTAPTGTPPLKLSQALAFLLDLPAPVEL